MKANLVTTDTKDNKVLCPSCLLEEPVMLEVTVVSSTPSMCLCSTAL